MEEANELFKVIVKIPTVKRISGFDYCRGIIWVDPQLLVSVYNRLEKLKLSAFMTSEQIALLFSTMAETNLKTNKPICYSVQLEVRL